MLDAVDTRGDEAGQRVLAEHVRSDAGALVMGGGDGGHQHVIGPQRRQIPHRPVDPVADQLHPAVAAAGLLGQRGGQIPLAFDFDGVATPVAFRAGQMPAGPDDARQVVVVVQDAGVGGRSAVAQQQGTGVTFDLGLGDRLLDRGLAVRPQADVAVRVDQSGNDPPTVPDGFGVGDRLAAQHPVGDPPLDGLAVG